MNLKSLVCAALAMLVFSILPSTAEAHAQSVGCGTVIDTPGNYQLSENLTCLVGLPPGLFCDKAAITITAPNVHLDGQGFTLTGTLAIGIGIQITAPNVQVRNVTVDSFDIGIEIREGGSNHLEAVNLKSSGGFLCSVGTGLRLINTTDNHVNRSNISGNGNWGVQLINSSGNQMNGNQIVDNRSRPGAPTGNIGLLSSHQNVISGNDLSRGGLYGIRAEESNGNVIFRNRLKDNGIPSGIGIGILLDRSENNLVHSNLVDREPVTTPPAESGFRGIVVSQGATQNVITANRVFIQFGVGILLDQNATQNVILGNRAKNNNPWDAQDDNTGCDANIWRANQFNRVNQSCIR